MAETNTELSASNYAIRRKELIQLIKQLRAVGAQADLDLPRITIIGSQSAGKSSVVEAISGITVPRDAGTCTRCPMECRLSSSAGPWSCRVSIRWEFDEDGERTYEVSEEDFGPRITNKADVELRIRQAQAAVLNPAFYEDSFLDMDEDEIKEEMSGGTTLRFSRNVVCVDLEGPNLTDLSFIDLPGLIQNAADDVVKLVEDLVVSHIKGNCVILVALPMTDDIENQKAMQIARKEDSTGRRTIGVITKPDMLTSGSTKARDLWLDVLEGRRHSLLHGYYCTRQLDDAERAEGVSAAEARVKEANFFAKTVPWSVSSCQDRFGTPNLVKTLSTLLVTIISDSLPKIQSETFSLLSSCTQQLSVMPPPLTGDVSTQMSILITSFCNSIEQLARGGPQAGQLIHENRNAWREFKDAIKATAPNFQPFPDEKKRGSDDFKNYLGDGEDEELVSHGQPFYLMDMRRHIGKSITRELPDNIPFEAKVSLIGSFQQSWETSTMICFNRVRESVLKFLHETINKQFERYANVRSHLRQFIAELVQKHYKRCLAILDTILEMEKTPFTQNTHYLEASTEKWFSKYKDAKARKEDGKNGWTDKEQLRVKQQTQERNENEKKDGSIDERPKAQMPTKKKKQETTENPFGSLGVSKPSMYPCETSFKQLGAVDSTADIIKFKLPTPASSTNTTLSTSPVATPSVPKPVDQLATQASPWTLSPSSQSVIPSRQLSKPARPSSGSQPLTKSTRALPDPEKVQAALAMLVEIGYSGITEDDLGKLNPTDEFETEMLVMAQIRGYFQVAFKRVIDNVPSIIDLRFVRAVANELLPFLIEKFELGTANATARCEKYLAEDPNIVARRDELAARKKRLESVTQELHNFGL